MTSLPFKILVLICVNLAMTGALTSVMTFVANVRQMVSWRLGSRHG